jgi:hypothetical protein
MSHTPGPWHRNIKPARKYSTIFAGQNTHVAHLATEGLRDEELEANCKLIAAAPELLDALINLLADVETLVSESTGVYGLHLNGDPAPWEELLEGGRFEWVTTLASAHAAIAKAEGR